MGFLTGDILSGDVAPWISGAESFLTDLRSAVTFDAVVLGIVDPRAPQPDELLIGEGVHGEMLNNWCRQGHREDELFRDARRKGVATGQITPDRPGPPLPAGHHAMVHALETSLTLKRTWYLALSRQANPFTEDEQQAAAVALRLLQAEFDHISEPGLGRVLLGNDDRLIHADPRSEAKLHSNQTILEELTSLLRPVIEQRWGEITDDVAHDLALPLNGQPVWVRFRRVKAADDLPQKYWYLELRPLTDKDIPAVGVVEDDRVARAVAFLSDRFAQAPTLGEVAESVNTSPFHFHRLFVRNVGVSPKHYLLRMQLLIAKWLLQSTRKPIGDIATATGFASHGHFTATFHRMVGVSPTAFREQ